jgi:hypothetical protein
MKALNSGRVAGSIMPAAFMVAIVFCLVRVGQTATHEYFVNKPSVNWEHTSSGEARAALVWAAEDGADWQVRYQYPSASQWRSALIRVAQRMNSEFFTKRLVYQADLSGLMPGAGVEYEVYRDQIKVYSGRVP